MNPPQVYMCYLVFNSKFSYFIIIYYWSLLFYIWEMEMRVK